MSSGFSGTMRGTALDLRDCLLTAGRAREGRMIRSAGPGGKPLAGGGDPADDGRFGCRGAGPCGGWGGFFGGSGGLFMRLDSPDCAVSYGPETVAAAIV